MLGVFRVRITIGDYVLVTGGSSSSISMMIAAEYMCIELSTEEKHTGKRLFRYSSVWSFEICALITSTFAIPTLLSW